MSEEAGADTAAAVDAVHPVDDDSTPIPSIDAKIPSIRDITSVDIDRLMDGDGIEQLQRVLRQLQRRTDDYVMNDVVDDVTVNDVIDDITTDQQRAKCRPTLSLEDQTSSVSATTSESLATTIKNEDEETTARDYTAQDSTTTHDDTADCCRKTQDGTGLGESLQHTTLITTAATKTQDRTDPDASQLADGEDLGSQDRTAGGDAEYKPQDKTMGPNASHLALILKLQRDMATMQLQLSNLQDAMRTANTTLQLLLQRAFADDQ